ncbi:MAG: hypothetical protein NTV70_16890 [Acidobacteria bacterium]|nr:hypothetical protein [Acidobacteriota bacterium]
MSGPKRDLLTAYKLNKHIDFIFLQEGDAGFDNATSEGNSTAKLLLFDRSSSAIEIVAAISSSGVGLGPSGGVNRAAYYNIVADAAQYADVGDGACSDYLANPVIKTWILVPAEAAVGGKRIDGKKVTVRRGTVEGSGDPNYKAALVEEILSPVQRRMNMLGHRRPKAVDLKARTLRIFYWHAPLGSETKLSEVGFSGSHSGVAKDGCGGELAVAANILFAKHLGAEGAFPDNTILLGDLNINAKAAQAIYHTTNVVSSDDGWCHAIANTSLPLTAEVTTLDQTALGYSDHSPIVFTIA